MKSPRTHALLMLCSCLLSGSSIHGCWTTLAHTGPTIFLFGIAPGSSLLSHTPILLYPSPTRCPEFRAEVFLNGSGCYARATCPSAQRLFGCEFRMALFQMRCVFSVPKRPIDGRPLSQALDCFDRHVILGQSRHGPSNG